MQFNYYGSISSWTFWLRWPCKQSELDCRCVKADLARATDPPTESILQRKPAPKNASIFTLTMWKMILGQAVYQLGVTFMLYFAGPKIFPQHLPDENAELVLGTIVFNTFVWMQIFNELNNRRLDNNYNVFVAMNRNYWYILVNCVMVGAQVLIVFVGGAAFEVTPLNDVQWGICIICAIACIPWAVVLRTIPDKYFGVVFYGVVDAGIFVGRPLVKGVMAVVRPVQRTVQRIRPAKKDDEEEDTATTATQRDEEAVGLTDMKREPTPEAPATPVTVPPITITTS